MRRASIYALLAAATFGLSVPLSKVLLDTVEPLVLAGLLYLGAGIALFGVGLARQTWLRDGFGNPAPLRRADLPWLGGALLLGGVLAPVLLLVGLQRTGAGAASLLLSLEGVFTIIMAGFVFREVVRKQVWLGALFVAGAASLLAAHGASGWSVRLGAFAIAGATLCWAVDNNLTGKVSQKDPVAIVRLKGLVAGSVNVALALALGKAWPSWGVVAGALGLGAVSYGLSLVFFVLALRGIGAARTSGLFGTAPLLGAALSAALFAESRAWVLLPAGALIGAGMWLLLPRHDEQWHAHKAMTHEHPHVHDEHHQHAHPPGAGPEPHTHVHTHTPMAHGHARIADAHHHQPGPCLE